MARHPSARVSAILFDFDGVIGRTMEANLCSWREAFSAVGVRFRREEYLSLEGAGVKEVVKVLGTRYGVDAARWDSIVKSKEAAYRRRRPRTIYRGVRAFLRELKDRGLKTALVTGSSRHRLLATLDAGLLDKFDVIVCGDEVKRTKPDPEPFNTAIERLGLSPRQCLAVENAPLGVTSAKAAGLAVVAVTTTLPRSHLVHAHEVHDSHRRLFQAIRRRVSRCNWD